MNEMIMHVYLLTNQNITNINFGDFRLIGRKETTVLVDKEANSSVLACMNVCFSLKTPRITSTYYNTSLK